MANTYQGFSATDFARSASTTLARHIREQEDAWVKNYQMGALLEANGRVFYNLGGRGFDWPVQFRLHNLEANTGETPRAFGRTNLWKTAQLSYRGYQATDAMYYREFLENKGEEGIVKVFDGFVTRLEQSVKQGLGPEYYVDGAASGNTNSWHGFESLFGTITQTYNISTGAAQTAAVADVAGVPTATYAAISTVPGNYGGENETSQVWPLGVADPHYDFWSPLVVNYPSSVFSATATWSANCVEALRYAIIHSQRNSSKDGQITNAVLSRDLYYGLLNRVDNAEQINIMRNQENGLVALGFKNVINFDGIDVSWEAAVPTAVGYGYNLQSIRLNSMDESLFRSEGPDYDLNSQAFLAVVSTLSNLQFSSPRNIFALKLLAAS
jgi:hypothetical protein